MEPRNYTVSEIFDGNQIYVVPRYQRLYVWNEEDQWAPLWEDITGIGVELLTHAEGSGGGDIDEHSAESHFFGTLVLKSSGVTPDMARKLRVIDGQQRLTTLQILMSAVAHELDRRGLKSQSDSFQKLLTNDHTSPEATVDNLKIVHGSDHYRGFREAMDPKSNKDDIPGQMGHCYRFFRRKVQGWLKEDYSALSSAALRTAIFLKLRVIAIYLERHEEEHKIFETLNARGEPLTEWDKLKNLLLYKADALPSLDQDSFFDRYLDSFDQEWWRENVGRGAGRRPRSDVFADYWLESKTEEAVAARRVFREFQHYVNKESHSLVDLGEELVKDAAHFHRFEVIQPGEASIERRFHNRRLAIEIGAWWPMLLGLERTFGRLDCGSDIRSQCFEYLESFLLRRLIVGHQARSYDQIGFEILRLVQGWTDSAASLPQAICDRFLRYTQAGNRWPEDPEIREAAAGRKMPRYVQHLVLEAIEARLIPTDAGYQVVSNATEVEHLMPIGWESNDWPFVDNQDDPEASSRRNELIHTLGNLTLINSGLNKRLSNRSWSHKRKLIEGSDNLFINRALLNNATDLWDEERINQRGRWMGDLMCEIWVRPG